MSVKISHIRESCTATPESYGCFCVNILYIAQNNVFTSSNEEELNMKQLEHHFHPLMHSTRDGEIYAKNIHLTVSGRVHKSGDITYTHSEQAVFKAIEEGKNRRVINNNINFKKLKDEEI